MPQVDVDVRKLIHQLRLFMESGSGLDGHSVHYLNDLIEVTPIGASPSLGISSLGYDQDGELNIEFEPVGEAGDDEMHHA